VTERGETALSLAGLWQFKLDPLGGGGRFSQWDSDAKITLPGSTDEAGQGEKNEAAQLYYLSRNFQYVGAAWYRRTITVPEGWLGRRVVLFLERPHWDTYVWLDDRYIGHQNSLSAPHEYELGLLEPGSYTVTIKVDNTPKIGVGDANSSSGHFNLAHSLTEHTQTNWNGVVGRIELRATDAIWLEDVQVYPDVASSAVRVVITVQRAVEEAVTGSLTLEVAGYPELTLPVVLRENITRIETAYALTGAEQWSEFTPALHTLKVRFYAEERYTDCRTVRFGLREFKTQGRQFKLNGTPVFLRGTLECCIFPLTGYPPTDVAAWTHLMKIAKAHGLNHLRFHSWCPPEAAFVAADELGLLLQVEGPFWAAFGSDPEVDRFAYAEGDRILKTYGNHPSFCMLAVSNEPSGEKMEGFFADILAHWRAADPRHAYTGGSGWPSIPENDFHVTPTPRAYHWGDGLNGRFNAEPFATILDYSEFISQYEVPVVSHEIGEWTSYPGFDQIKKYTGILEPRNLKAFRASLEAQGMLERAERFTAASGNLQVLLYKEEIEAALRTPEFGGFQLLSLSDFPGQGTALVGVLDAFWDSKGYVTPEAFREFCAETVLLARLPKVVWQQGETFTAQLEIAHFGAEPLYDQTLRWEIVAADGTLIASDTLQIAEIPLGSGIPLGSIETPLEVDTPARLTLQVELEGTPYRNHWDLWFYPAQLTQPEGVHVTHQLDEQSLEVLRGGGSVLFLPLPETVLNDVPLGFTTPFWNTAWTEGQPPPTLGVLCDPEHPALASFPTYCHSSWQWWELLHGSKCLHLDGLPQVELLIQVIDDWFTNRKLALALEAEALGGKLLICSADLATDLESRPVARQLRASLLSYMKSDAFLPSGKLSLDHLAKLVAAPKGVVT